ncbi:MAG: tetratricopeptide repeat protein, partial [Gemmatimonadales bacterium]
MARTMGVGAVVRGSIQKSGDTLRVRLQFLRAPDSVLLFTRDYRVRLGQIPDLQRQITADITESLGAGVNGTERSPINPRSEVDQRAYEGYLRGRFHLERGELEQARALFEESSRMAPEWAPPYVGLANYYTSLPFSTDIPPAEVLPRARAALARALELDESLAEAHAAIAYIRAYYEWDWRAAEQEFRRALELSPSYADAYFSYSRFLASRGRLDEAMAQLGRAVELDPLSPSLLVNRALLEYFAGRYDDSERELREILKSDSTDLLARWALALVAEQQGRADEAIAILQPISSGT